MLLGHRFLLPEVWKLAYSIYSIPTFRGGSNLRYRGATSTIIEIQYNGRLITVEDMVL